jgi:hypothetical protein
MFTFNIAHWIAWAPGLTEASDWRQWAQAPYCPLHGQLHSQLHSGETPRVDFLPALQRRRLGTMARAALACAWPLAEGQPPMPLVFASQHGETTRGFDLLQTLARGETVSPTSFGLSVHNATAGLWSILRRETTEGVALSAQDDSLEHALLEATLLLEQDAPGVIVLATEETPPAAYRPWIEHHGFPYAVALRVTAGTEFRLRCAAPETVPEQARPGRDTQLPNPLNLLRHLLLDTAHWHHASTQRCWHWEHSS